MSTKIIDVLSLRLQHSASLLRMVVIPGEDKEMLETLTIE